MKPLRIIRVKRRTAEHVTNASIMAGLGFFSTLAGLTATQLTNDWSLSFTAAAIAAGLNFFSTLAVQRGLQK